MRTRGSCPDERKMLGASVPTMREIMFTTCVWYSAAHLLRLDPGIQRLRAKVIENVLPFVQGGGALRDNGKKLAS